MAGVFFAVVGASGAGKDTVLAGVRAKLGKQDMFYFPTRFITRPQNAGGENHIGILKDRFFQNVQENKFSLWWSAHGLHYGLSDDIFDKLKRGVNVVANISRGSVTEAASRFGTVEVIEITASPEVIRKRLMERRRENQSEIAARQLRDVDANWRGQLHRTVIQNNEAPAKAVDSFVKTLLSLSTQTCTQV